MEQLERRHSFDVPRASTNYTRGPKIELSIPDIKPPNQSHVYYPRDRPSRAIHTLPLENFSIRLDQFILPPLPIRANLLSLLRFPPPPPTFLRSRNFKRLMTDMAPRTPVRPPRERQRRRAFNRPKDALTHRFSKLLHCFLLLLISS